MQKIISILALLAVLAIACNLPFTIVANPPTITPTQAEAATLPTNVPLPATEMPGDLTAAPTPVAPGNGVIVGNISFVIPTGLASTATHEVIARAESDQVAPWEVAPEHTVFTLEDFSLPGKQMKAQIFVYPADDYANINQGVAENIKKIKALTSESGMDVNNDTMPHVPFYNAAQVIAAQTQVFNFRNGAGVRYITQYGQDVSPITNNWLFYTFQGLTSDGKIYIVAIFPIEVPVLAQGDVQNSPVPSDGVPFPDYNDPNANFPAYFDAVTQKLNSLSPDAFSPVITQIDALIQTIQVVP